MVKILPDLIWGDPIFAGNLVGQADEDKAGGYTFLSNAEFAREFAKRTSMKISTYKGKAFEIEPNRTKPGHRFCIPRPDGTA